MIHKEKLDSLCHINSGGTPSRGIAEYYGGKIPWAKIGDIEKSNGVIYSTEEYITEAGLESIGNRIFPKDTLLFAMYGSVGKVAFCGIELSTNQAILGIRLKQEAKEKLDLEYLKYWFQVNLLFFKSRAVGGILKNLSATIVRDFDIPLPSLTDQKRIAKVLSECEELIQKRTESINLLDDLLKSKFIEMFGTPETNPFGWDEKVFGDYTEYIGDIGSNGSNDTVSKNLVMSDTEDYAIMIRTTNLNANDFTKNLKYISKETYDFFSKSKIFGGEIIMNKIGSPGKFWIMPNLGRPVSLGLNQFVIRLRDLNTNYIKYFLSTNFGEVNIQSRTQGATTKSITKSAVRSLPVLYPPMELQIEFSELVDKVEAVKNKFNESLKELENLYGSISQRAFNGELDLSKVDISNMEDSKKKDEKFVMEKEKQDITFMTLADFLQIPEEIQMQQEGIELDFIDDPLFYQFFLKNHFKDRSFLLEDVEGIFNQIYIPKGHDYNYETWKEYIFNELKSKSPKIEQYLDEESKVKRIKLKLTDEAFKA